MTIQVFDKPMCCSSGVCGPQVDPTLVRFAADLDWLRRQNVQVERFNLAQQPGEFAGHDDVRSALQSKGTDALPIIRVDGQIVCQGEYPQRDLLASWAHVSQADSLPAIKNCNPGGGCC
jgi:arsenite methyltransferase